MGCGESKHAVVTENATIPKNKRSLSSKSNSTKGETQNPQENVKKTENGESGIAETVKTSDEKLEVTAKVEEVIAPKVVAVEEAKENSENKEMVELEKAREELKKTEEVVEEKEEKVAESQPKEKKNGNDETTPAVAVSVAVVEKKESAEEIKAEEKTGETIKPTKEKVKDAAKPEAEEKPKEENATETSATTD